MVSLDHSNSLLEKHLDDLLSSGLTPEQAAIAGHFSVDRDKAKDLLGHDVPGLIFSYSDISGKPFRVKGGKAFLRIKPDWGSQKKEDSPKYLSQAKKGSRPYFSKLNPDWQKVAKSAKYAIWETEGEKKGDCGCANGLNVIAFSGVWGWLDRCSRKTEKLLENSRVLPELDSIIWKGRRVNQCFDSDIIEKLPVQEALAKRAIALEKLGAEPYLVVLPNEIDGSKNGLDDFIVRHGVETLKFLAKNAKPTSVKTSKKDGKKLVYLDLPEPRSHGKAVLAWSVLKETWAWRPGVGWYRWSRTRWNLSSDDEFEVDLTRFMDAQGWENRSTGEISSVVREVKSRMLVPDENWQPFHKLAFKNGTLNISSGEFVEGHDQKDWITQLLPFDFDLTAQCPRWLLFLQEAMDGDQARVDLLQAVLHHASIPYDRNKKSTLEKSFDFYGRKGTGKGTVLDVLAALVGEENIGPANAETFKDAVGLGRLIDKRLAVDYDASGFLNNVGSFNQVVSNEPVSVKKLYKDAHIRRLGVVVVRAYNAFISVPDGAEGLDRRMVVIPFQNPPKTIDTSLSEKLRAELSGIFAWCYQISDEEAKRRILAAGRIPAIAQACAERFEANNPELNFLVERYQDGIAAIKAGTLYQEYRSWCHENGHMSKSLVKFRPALENLGCQRSNKTCGRYFYNIPPMSKFDTTKHLGIDRTDTGIVEGQDKDSSSSCPEQDRDSCRQLKLQNFHSENHLMEFDSGEEFEPQLSTTIPKPEPASLPHSQQPSPIVPSNYPYQKLKVGDRAVLVGDEHSRPFDEFITSWKVQAIKGNEVTVSHPNFGNRKFDKSWLQVQPR